MNTQWWGSMVTVAVLAAVLGACGRSDGAPQVVPAEQDTRQGAVVTGPVHVPGTMRAV